jgi:hypothetical protein
MYNKQILIRLSETQKNGAQKRADSLKISLTEYLRNLLTNDLRNKPRGKK